MKKLIISETVIQSKIFLIRGQKVMLDKDLAELYGVETKVLKQAVNRNKERLPSGFLLVLTQQEFMNLRSQFVTSNWGGHRYLPLAFTEHGILMLYSILRSKKAVQVNIQIMRAFTKLRELMLEHKDLREKIESMEKKYDHQFRIVFEAIKKLLEPQKNFKKPIGFHS